MSVKEARKLLDKDAKDMTDEQITKLVEEVDELAKLAIEVAKNKIRREQVNA
jgi:ribonuclease HIII